MSQVLEVNGEWYVSSSEAAQRMGVTRDYVGLLARIGRLKARKLVGAWWIEVSQLKATA